jgi:hypothetical protein
MCLTENLTLECAASILQVPVGINGAVRVRVPETTLHLQFGRAVGRNRSPTHFRAQSVLSASIFRSAMDTSGASNAPRTTVKHEVCSEAGRRAFS